MENAILPFKTLHAASQDAKGPSHLVFVSTHGAGVGGAERYIKETAMALQQKSIRCSLLYEVCGETDSEYLKVFDTAFPIVDLSSQIKASAAQCVYVHKLSQESLLQQCLDSGLPVLRFYHDHQLFCLREHKYTALSHATCTKTIGLNCYACLGFIGRNKARRLELRSLSTLKRNIIKNKQVAAYLVGSNYMAEHLITHGFDNKKMYVAPLYSHFQDQLFNFVRRHPRRLLFVGQLVRGKGLDILLKALAKSSHKTQLFICGDGVQREKYEAMTKALDLQSSVRFLGNCSHKALMDLYRECTALIIPSRAPETFCLSGIEALSQACPVIASDVGGISQWLHQGVTGCAIPSNNVEALLDAIDILFSNPAHYESMAKKGCDLVREKFTQSAHIERLLSILSHSYQQSKEVVAC